MSESKVKVENGIMSPVKDDKKEKKVVKIPYKKALELQQLLGMSHDDAVKAVAKLVEAGKVTDPNASFGGFSRDLSEEEIELKEAFRKLLHEHKGAVDVLKAQGKIYTAYFKGAGKGENNE